MHVCEEFRERISDKILDGIGLEDDAAIRAELLVCRSCNDFVLESREALEAMAAIPLEPSEYEWAAMANRLRTRIYDEQARAATPRVLWSNWFLVPVFATAAAALLLVVTLRHPAHAPATSVAPVSAELARMPSVDPVTAEYLQDSELFLRTVMKLKPNSLDDVDDARRMARRQLVELQQRKHAVAEVKPLVQVMDKYETVLRDIRNLSPRPLADDISDIKSRIEKNSLITNLTAFQAGP